MSKVHAGKLVFILKYKCCLLEQKDWVHNTKLTLDVRSKINYLHFVSVQGQEQLQVHNGQV